MTHVSWDDAQSYCLWKGMRLATEIEWEYAARGGLDAQEYPWGDLWQIKRSNLWQGDFPNENQLRDGYERLSPVDAYPAQNSFEIYDLIGNTWEWTFTKFHHDDHKENDQREYFVVKGGSFVDTRDGDSKKDQIRVRTSARKAFPRDYTAENLSFRCAQTIDDDDDHSPHSPFKENEKFRLIRLRPPIHHHSNEPHQHQYHQDEL